MTTPFAARAPDWPGYLAGFHTCRPGITERVLHLARRGADDPCGWLLAAVPAHGLVLDVACGSAPLWPRLVDRRYLGVDTSAAELTLAHARGARGLARASATALPLTGSSVDVMVCSMALQVLCPLPDVLAEIGRVLTPSGRLVATVPARGPLRAADLPALAGL